MTHTGSLSYHPSVIKHPDVSLLADYKKGEIFSYNVTSKHKQIHVTDLSWPQSVSFLIYNSHLYYIVCETDRHQVHVYNSTWGLYQTLGGTQGSGDGQLDRPGLAVGLPDGSVIVYDHFNKRASSFTIHGKFVRHILKWSWSGRSQALYVSLPYLIHVDSKRVFRYKLY